MDCKLEIKNRKYELLYDLGMAYSTGRFDVIFPELAEECVFESQWVLKPLKGKEDVIQYLSKKGNALRESGDYPGFDIVELTGNINFVNGQTIKVNGANVKNARFGLAYQNRDICLLLDQTIDDNKNEMIVQIQMNKEGLIKRIDLCVPELFQYRYYNSYFLFWPCCDNIEDKKHSIRVNDYHIYNISFLFERVGFEIDVYYESQAPIDIWCEALNNMKTFFASKTFDEAFEYIAGIDYSEKSIKYPQIARNLGTYGKILWDNRDEYYSLVFELIEWTELYKHSNNYIYMVCGDENEKYL